MRMALLTVVLLGVGAVAGHYVAVKSSATKCPKDLSRALEGCEVTAMAMNRMLANEEWESTSCKAEVVAANDRVRRIVETLFQYGWIPAQ